MAFAPSAEAEGVSEGASHKTSIEVGRLSIRGGLLRDNVIERLSVNGIATITACEGDRWGPEPGQRMGGDSRRGG